MKTESIPESAVVIGENAYCLGTTDHLTWYQRNPDGLWETVIASGSMCWG